MALPVVQGFPLAGRHDGHSTPADGRQQGHFVTGFNQGVKRAPLAVDGDGEAERNPRLQVKFHHHVTNAPTGLEGARVATTTQPFGQRSKRQHVDGDIIALSTHASRSVQGFINAVPSRGVMVAALQASNLWKLYQAGESTVEAVRGVELTVVSGEMVAVMGPSGCGKTTLLNILSGIDEPSAGNVLVNGEPLYGISDNARTDLRGRQFGFIFQDFNLLPVLSAVENVELPLLLLGTPSNEARAQALEALSRVGLADRSEHRPSELSGGQQQRVAVARAIVHRPSIILCDEPTGNLDTGTSRDVMALLISMNQQEGTTFLIVTHDEAIAAQCQRTIRMQDGLVQHEPSGNEREEE